ncbi:MAG: hypothetical protein ACI4DS_06545 [Eubacterium sp.]
MKNIVHDIMKNKNLDINIPKYIDAMSDICYSYSAIRLAMNYYTYYQMITEIPAPDQSEVRSIVDVLNGIIKSDIINDTDKDEAIIRISDLRENIIGRMHIYTAYTDRLNIYEYVLNRAEYRFDKFDMPKDYTDEMFAGKVMQYIFSSEDNAVINKNISEVIQQLPVRMTKGKFFELLNAGVDVYSESSKSTLDDFLYMLRTSAMLDAPEEMDIVSSDLSEICSDLSKLDFEKMTQNDYHKAMDKIKYASEYLIRMVDLYVMAAELVNDIYVLLLVKDRIKVTEEIRTSWRIMASVNNDFIDCNGTSDDDIMDYFISLEGLQEKFAEEKTRYDIIEDILLQYINETDKLHLTNELEKFRTVNILTSGSLFVDLNKLSDDGSIVDLTYLEECKSKLFDDLSNLFENSGKYIKRAVMASILSELPVFFNNINEIQEYVYNSISGCRDMAEKQACIQIISEIIGD